jgi:hypothetical protein
VGGELLEVVILNIVESRIAANQQQAQSARYGEMPGVRRRPSNAFCRIQQQPMLLDEGIVFGKAYDPLVDAQLAEPLHAGDDDTGGHEDACAPGPQSARPVDTTGPHRPDRLLEVLPSLLERDALAAIECVREVLACAAHLALVFMGQAKRRNDFVGS